MQRRIDGVVNRNSIKAGGHVRWGDTEIIETEGAVGTDPWRNAFGRDWWRDFEDKLTARLKRQGKLKDRRISFGWSFATDSAASDDRLLLGKLSGLRFYFSQLGPNEKARLEVVRPLLAAIEQENGR